MSAILKREVYYDYTGGLVRFWDWCLVTTPLGTMAEPFQEGGVNPNREFDPTDEIARIDSMEAMPIDKHMLMLSGGNHQLNGGTLSPRVGR